MIRGDTIDTIDTEDKTYKQIHRDIDQFLSVLDSSPFKDTHIDGQFNYRTRDAKRYRWQVLEAKVKQGVLKRGKVGVYRKVDTDLNEIDVLGAKEGSHIPLKLPLGLEKYIRVYRESIIIIAGSPGSGKTGWMYDLIMLNAPHDDGIVLWNNDMTDVEIKERLMNWETPLPNPLPFKVYERSDRFGDAVSLFPNSINAIDYLDLNSDVYLVGDEIDDVHHALKGKRGIAIIGIQKRPGQDIGIGGIFTWKRPKYYFSIDVEESVTGLTRTLKVVKSRGRVDPKVNIQGKVYRYDLAGGVRCKLRQ